MVETYQGFIHRIENILDEHTDKRVKLEELGYAFSGIPIYQNRGNSQTSYHSYERLNKRNIRNKRRLFLHITSYLPPYIRGMTDTQENIWINCNEYEKDHVLNHELIHVLHPEWSESTVREFHTTYIVDKSQFELVRN